MSRRIESVENLDREDVRSGDLPQNLEVVDMNVIEEYPHLIVLINARPAPSLDARRLTADFAQLHVRHGQPERVPGRLGTGPGDRFRGDHPPGARRVRLRDP